MTDDTAQKPEEQTFSVEALIEGAGGLFNASPIVVAGALSGERRKAFTAAQAQSIIDKWLKRPVEHGQAQDDPEPEE